jgi:hypothetical protein
VRSEDLRPSPVSSLSGLLKFMKSDTCASAVRSRPSRCSPHYHQPLGGNGIRGNSCYRASASKPSDGSTTCRIQAKERESVENRLRPRVGATGNLAIFTPVLHQEHRGGVALRAAGGVLHVHRGSAQWSQFDCSLSPRIRRWRLHMNWTRFAPVGPTAVGGTLPIETRQCPTCCRSWPARAARRYLQDCERIVYPAPHASRLEAPWTSDVIRRVATEIAPFPFVEGFTFDRVGAAS